MMFKEVLEILVSSSFPALDWQFFFTSGVLNWKWFISVIQTRRDDYDFDNNAQLIRDNLCCWLAATVMVKFS
jgi:hypothetical protein